MYKYFRNNLRNIKDAMILDLHTFLVDHILVKVDRASMAYSIEARIPLIDHKLVEYIMSLDHKLIFRKNKKKYLLKELAKSLLPPEIIKKKKKVLVPQLVNLDL